MTTTGIATHDHAPEATTAPDEPAAQTKRSRFVFGIVLFVASFFTGLALFLVGSGGLYGPIPYFWLAGLIIGVFNIAIMIYPVMQARAHKAQVKVRTRIAIAAVIMSFIGTPVVMWVGQMLVGPDNGNILNYVLGGIAPFMNATAAFMLAYITNSQRSKVPDLEARLEIALSDKARRDQEWQGAQAEVSTLTTARNTKKLEWERLHSAAEAAEKLVKKAQKTLNKSGVNRELDEANKAHPFAEQAVADKLAEISEDKNLAKAGLSEEIRNDAKARLVVLNEELANLKAGVQVALNRAKEAKKQFDASPEQAALNARVEESIAANELRDTANRELKDIEKRLKAATAIAGEKAALHDAQSSEVTRLTDELETARSNEASSLRDVIAGPVTALVLSLLMYPNWYIWVETTNGTTGL